ncbi:hypothetical protein ACU4GD_10265 [Cupriavidus basilensis]
MWTRTLTVPPTPARLRDIYTQGASKLGARDPPTDGAQRRATLTDGARNSTRDKFSDGA